MKMGDSVRHGAAPCPKCGHVLNAAAAVGEVGAVSPEPGDASVCIKCAAVLVYAEGLALRLMTDEEFAGLSASEHDGIEEVRRAVLRVRAKEN